MLGAGAPRLAGGRRTAIRWPVAPEASSTVKARLRDRSASPVVKSRLISRPVSLWRGVWVVGGANTREPGGGAPRGRGGTPHPRPPARGAGAPAGAPPAP